ncbi:hypothetical protein GR247_15825 [Rhizobium leguminosarum]|uniref:hypothetical protein n=1 Tax=Rhizobium sp. 814_E9_N1_1 TaxID=3276276 RepID=UPI0013B9D0C6|nr:hypothetical protein [Rhizobium leguminosarum]
MRSATAAVALLAFMPTVVVAQAFDWSAQLGKSTSALQAALGQASRCASGGFTVPVRWINKDTTLSDNLFDPVDTPGPGFISIGGKPDPARDYDEERALHSRKLTSIRCTIGREATVEAYAYEDRLVRIKLRFDRCDSRELREDKLFGNIMGSDKPLMVERCDDVDLKEKDFDTALYQSIKARNKYGYDREGSPGMLDFQWSGDMYGEYGQAERSVLWDVLCYRHSRDELSRMVPPDGIDVPMPHRRRKRRSVTMVGDRNVRDPSPRNDFRQCSYTTDLNASVCRHACRARRGPRHQAGTSNNGRRDQVKHRSAGERRRRKGGCCFQYSWRWELNHERSGDT